MKVRTKDDYYFTAQIMRDSALVLRQGVIKAAGVREALDEVNRLAKEVWHRTIFKASILDPDSGELLATNTIGEGPKEEKKFGYVPWNKPIFSEHQIGSYFNPRKFNKNHLY